MALTCKVLNSAAIAYFVNGKLITNSAYNSRYKARCQTLKIDEVKYSDDDAVFTCKVHSQYGFDVRNATLRVLGECIFIFSAALLAF